MLNKEEIEKVKEIMKPLSIGDFVTWFTSDGIVEMEVAAKTLLQYIQELETSNEELDRENNRLEMVETERDEANKEIQALKKGQASLMASRKKWKDRYYKLKRKSNRQNKISDEMVDSFFRLYQQIPGTMHKFFENGKPCEYGYDKETHDCKEINCKDCIKQYFEKKVEKNDVKNKR